MVASRRTISAWTALAGLLLGASVARGAAPFQVSYGGRLTQNGGAPVGGPVDLRFGFFDAAKGGAQLGAPVTAAAVTLANGVFQVALPLDGAAWQAVLGAGEAVWVEVTDVTHVKTYPRQQLSAVPYALRVPVDGTSVVFDAGGSLSVGAVDAAKVTGLSAMLAGMGDAAKLQGVPLDTGTPAAGAVLKFVGGKWQATPGDSVAGNFGIGTTSAQTALDVAGVLTQRGAAAPGVAPAGEGRIYYDSSTNQFLVSQNGGAYAPLGTVTGGVITQVSAGTGLTGGGTTGNVTVGLASVGTAGTYAKVQTDGFGRVTAGTTLTAADLPSIPVSHLTGALPVTQLAGTLAAAQVAAIPAAQVSGTLAAGQIPGLAAAQITSGTLSVAQIPSLAATQITSGTLAVQQIPQLSTSLITSGTLAVALGGTGVTSFPAGGVVVGAGALPLSTVGATSQYQLLQQGASGPVFGAVELGQGAAVSGVLAVANGGTGSNAALTGNRLMVSTGGAIVEAPGLVVAGGNLGLGTAPGSALDVAGALSQRGMGAPAVAPAGQGRLYFDASANQFLVSQNGGAYAPLASGAVGTITGVTVGAGLTGGGTAGSVTVALPGVGLAGTYTKVLTDAYGRVTGSATLVVADLPSLPASQITSGTFAASLLPPHSAALLTSGTLAVQQLPQIPASLVTGSLGVAQLSGTLATAQLPTIPTTQLSGTLGLAQIPALPASQITSGAFSTAQIPSLPASQITSGVFSTAQIPSLPASYINAGTLAPAQIPALPASQIASGTLAAAQLPPLSWSMITGAGTLAVASGGTGQNTLPSNGVLLGNGTSPVNAAAGTANQVLLVPSGGGAPAFAQITDANVSATAALQPAKLAQAGATSNQNLVWTGSAWTPQTPLFFNQLCPAGQYLLGFDASGTKVCQSLTPSLTKLSRGGYLHMCAVVSDTTVRCWGYDAQGELGDNGSATRTVPVVVHAIDGSPLSGVTDVAAGNEFTCALKSDGTVWCWGYNNYGQLGNGTTTASNYPVQVSGITTATSLSVGWVHACAVLADTSVKCWGYNAFGQLGNNTLTNSSSPVQVLNSGGGTFTGASKISNGGADHSCVLKTDSSVWCWGYNAYGQLGNGNTTNQSTPVQVNTTNLTAASQVAAFGAYNGTSLYDFTCAIKTDGTVWCWGFGGDYALGNGATANSSVPVQVVLTGGGNLTSAATIGGASWNPCVVTTSGAVYTWGYNNWSQLGDGTSTSRATASPVHGVGGAGTLSVPSTSTCGGTMYYATALAVIRANGSAVAWGYDAHGELGNNDTTTVSSPVGVQYP